MKKYGKSIMALVTALVIAGSPVMQAFASNTYDASMETVSEQVLFPGDTLTGVSPIIDASDWHVVDESGYWVNSTDKAYKISPNDGEEGGVLIDAAGYALTVKNGTSRADSEPSAKHFSVKDPSDQVQIDEMKDTDLAAYPEGCEVTITAMTPPEGQVFDHWDVPAEASVTDAYASTTTLWMPDRKVTVTAVFGIAPVETEAPADNPEMGGEDWQDQGQDAGWVDQGQDIVWEDNTWQDQGQDVGGDNTWQEGENSGQDTTWDSGWNDQGAAENVPEVVIPAPETEAQPVTYTLTMVNAATNDVAPVYDNVYELQEGVQVTVYGEDPAGMEFESWSAGDIYGNSYDYDVADPAASWTTFTMPAADVVLTANYTLALPAEYTLTVVNGEGSQTVAAGETVTVFSNQAAENWQFSGWSAEGVTLDDPSQGVQTFVMPENDVVLTANFEYVEPTPVLYHLTVVNGEGTGEKEAGETVTVFANAPEEGWQFTGWSTEGIDLEDAFQSVQTITMPEWDVTLTALYEVIPTEPETEPPTEPVVETQPETEPPTELVVETQPETQAATETETQLQTETETDAPVIETEPAQPETDAPAAEPVETELEEGEEDETDVDAEIETDDEDDDVTEETREPQDETDASEPETDGTILYSLVVGGVSEDQSQLLEAGTVVEVHADETQVGLAFAGWEEEGIALEDPTAESVTFEMPENDVMLSAQYEEETPETYGITIVSGNGPKNAQAGEEVVISADDPEEGKVFAGWSADEDLMVNSPESPVATFIMPEHDVTLTADYADAEEKDPEEPTYTLTVNNGLGSGTDIVAGTRRTVAADDDPEGKVFDYWNAEGITLSDTQKNARAFELEMPEGDVTLTAIFTEKEAKLYTVTIVNGTVNGKTSVDVTAGTELTAVANAPEDGKEFDRWVGYNIAIANPLTEAVTFTVPEANVTLAAQYQDAAKPVYTISYGSDIAISGNLTQGATSVAHAGDNIIMRTTEVSGYDFTGWSVTRNDTGAQVAYVVLNDYLSAGFIMPDANVTIKTLRKQVAVNEVVVLGGSGSGTYPVGTTVTITANQAPAGYKFKQWNVISGNVVLNNAYAATTAFTMPNAAVRISAEYEPIYYTLTVKNGTGSAIHLKAGDKVSIAAYMPTDGKEFSSWYVASKNAAVANPGRFYTTITMPAADVVVQATYKDAHSSYYNYIGGIEEGGTYRRGSQITFYGSGNGMDNEWPNPGDVRWEPTGYQIGTVTGSWATGSSYSTTMSVNANGDYTLYVTFLKEIFDGTYWASTGVTDTKSVTFHVSDNIAAQTGDDTNVFTQIVLPAILGVLAVIVIAVLAIVLVRRRKRR